MSQELKNNQLIGLFTGKCQIFTFHKVKSNKKFMFWVAEIVTRKSFIIKT